MGWEQFKGHTERVDTSKIGSNSGNFAKAFGDAFGQIGNDMIASKNQANKDKLFKLQLANEQVKFDDAKEVKTQKKFDDAYKTDIGTLDLNTTGEAKQNAIDSLKAFHKPSVDAQSAVSSDVANKEKTITAQNNDTYKGMVLNAPNKQELADAWAMSDLGDRGYKPNSDIVKERDNFFQGKFNDAAVEKSVSGGYKNMDAFSKANPDLVKNADGITMSKVEAFYNTKDQQQHTMDNQDKTLQLQKDKLIHDISNDNQTLEIARTKAANGGDGGGSSQEKDSKVVDAINKIVATKFGKADQNGGLSIGENNAPRADWLGTRALQHASNGHNASTAFVKAEQDFNKIYTVDKKGALVLKTKNNQNGGLPGLPGYVPAK